VAVILASAVVGIIVIEIGSGNPVTVAQGLVQGSVGNSSALVASLAQTTPLIFAALSFAVAFRSGVFNAGGQGQFVMGAFGAALAGFEHPLAGLPGPIHLALVLVSAAAFGAAWSAVPILLKLWLGTDEILTTLMLSYAALELNDWLVLDIFRNPSVQAGTNAQTRTLSASAGFPLLVGSSSLSFMIIVSVGLCVAAALYYRYTVAGYESRLVGSNQRLAAVSGVRVKQKMLTAMLCSGAIAGLAGASVVGGFFHADISPFVTNVGFNGILASLLVGNVPVAIPFGAFFFGALQQGGLGLQIFSNQSQYIADVLTAVVIVFVAMRHRPVAFARMARKIVRTRDTGGSAAPTASAPAAVAIASDAEGAIK
jgi:simple sugar transport system permease protein